MDDYDGDRQRTIRLKETRRNRNSWLTPSPEYRALCDTTLGTGPFHARGTPDGFLDSGNTRPDANRNLLMLGGSFVESMYAAEQDRFASQLERRLPPKWRVLNGGYSGMSTLHLASLLLAKAPMHQPRGSAVLIFIGQSDLEVMEQPGSYWSTKHRVTPIQPAPEKVDVRWENAEAMRRMIDTALGVADSLGLRYGVVASPFRDADFATDEVLRRQYGRDRALYRRKVEMRRAIVAATAAAAERHRAPFLNGHAKMRPEHFYDVMHLNQDGQDAFTDLLDEWVHGWLIDSRAYADDMCADYCAQCGTAFSPLPGLEGSGHACDHGPLILAS